MNNLRLYKIDINYIKYLYSFDNRVQYNPDREDVYSAKRPYLGVVLKIDKYDYFVPLEHPRQSHQTMKNNIFIFKIHNGTRCTVNELRKVFLCPAFGFSFAFDLPA